MLYSTRKEQHVQRPVVKIEFLGTKDLRGDHSVWASEVILVKQVGTIGLGP